MEQKGKFGFGLFVAAILCLGCAGWAEASSLTMGRVLDTDMAKYIALTCIGSPTCIPATREPLLDIAQPATGDPVKVIPATLAGRVCYKSEDSVGNQSLCSNIIPFRGAVLSAPTLLPLIP